MSFASSRVRFESKTPPSKPHHYFSVRQATSSLVCRGSLLVTPFELPYTSRPFVSRRSAQRWFCELWQFLVSF
ncbi:hypothetical protein Csa_016556 [Cucumis sativus]|uniref:Uncharacterized protein n=1 Tax=Cucumis sativus TaxID=3659 RepID=A0A0A0K865_CUCSA|nr:hypothetical protein Csa_016556 [Cucumis sativus]